MAIAITRAASIPSRNAITKTDNIATRLQLGYHGKMGWADAESLRPGGRQRQRRETQAGIPFCATPLRKLRAGWIGRLPLDRIVRPRAPAFHFTGEPPAWPPAIRPRNQRRRWRKH